MQSRPRLRDDLKKNFPVRGTTSGQPSAFPIATRKTVPEILDAPCRQPMHLTAPFPRAIASRRPVAR